MSIFKKKIYLITGGTGSFGSTMVNSLLKKNGVKEIRIFSRDENKQEKLRLKYNSSKLKFYIGDIRDFDSLGPAMTGVDYVFHAAALKQVPSCEFYPLEAVKTNIIGTKNVIECCKIHKVKKAIFLSTDKAVYPVNAMGITKALMEKVILSYANDKNLNLCITRYGNVMGSRGSVIPLFIDQIKNNKPITITDLHMKRFLMSLDDSVDLVFEALRNGKSGEIFVQKSTTIENLAMALAKMLKKKIKVKIIGVRHGEKMYEVLVSKEEMIRTSVRKNFFIIKQHKNNQNYKIYFTNGIEKINEVEEYNSKNTVFLDLNSTVKFLKKKKILMKNYEF